MAAAERKIPAPPVNAENARYYEAAAQGKLLVGHCGACNAFHCYPRVLCPHCLSERTDWREASGRGVVYAYSVMRRGVPEPYAIAYVALDEGVTMLANLVDCDFDAIRIGRKVRAVFKAAEGGAIVPLFTFA
jgi:uncharacterized OB-fold protein